MLTVLLCFPNRKFILRYSLKVPASYLRYLLKLEVDTPLGKGSYRQISKGLVSLFFFICLINILGLLPYVFTPTAHIVLPLSLAVPLWLASYLYGWRIKPQIIFTHLVPIGTPPALMPPIVIIERIRGLIRPITLSIRLMANIVAGHLLLRLTRSSIQGLTSFVGSISAQFVLLGLEIAVAIIQGYVFIILITLYLKEVFAPLPPE